MRLDTTVGRIVRKEDEGANFKPVGPVFGDPV
jgi:hypothetical protein